MTASGNPGCLPNDNPIESYHKMLTRMKVLTYRASTETFLNSSLPRVVFLASLDLCSPVQRGLRTMMAASSLKGALYLLEVQGWDPVHISYHSDSKPDAEGAFSVYVLNATSHAHVKLTKERVCWAAAPPPPSPRT